jgi:hypothetical protein
VINDSLSQINFRREFAAVVQIFVNDIASSEENTGDLDCLADFQTPDLFLGEWTGQLDHLLISKAISGFDRAHRAPRLACDRPSTCSSR